MVVSAHHAASAQPAPQAGGSLNGWLGAVYELLDITLVGFQLERTQYCKYDSMVFYEHTPPFPSTSTQIIPCTESHTNISAQLHSTILKFPKRFPDLDLLWTVLNQWDKKKGDGNWVFISPHPLYSLLTSLSD